MTESEVLKQVAQLGIGGVVAVFMFLLYRRDLKDAREQAAVREAERRAAVEQRTEEYRRQADKLEETVMNNTRVMAMLEGTNAQLSRAVEALGKEPDHGRQR